jgi:hypothetical protein
LQRTFIKADNVGIAFIYCNYKEDQAFDSLLGSLLQQLVQRQSHVSDVVRNLYKSHVDKETRPSIGEYSRCLQSEIGKLSKKIVVIDALDECPLENKTRQKFLSGLQKLLPQLHLLITSRTHIEDLQRTFKDAGRLEIRASDEDIEIYLQERIEEEIKLKRFIEKDPSLQGAIISTIVESVNGMSVHLSINFLIR